MAMGGGLPAAETGLAPRRPPRPGKSPDTHQGTHVKKTALILRSILLSAVLAGSAMAAETVDINTADAATLDRVLNGVGPSKADAIVAHRKQHGAFRSADELAEVKGIGLSTIEQNRDRIKVGAGARVAAPAAAKPKPKAPATASN
jgi:competence protein ComEA